MNQIQQFDSVSGEKCENFSEKLSKIIKFTIQPNGIDAMNKFL